MRVAIITPYFSEPDRWIRYCHESVLAQIYSDCTHILVADGAPRGFVSVFQAQHIVLPKSHGDYGNTPRAIGSFSAIAQGFDAIAYLDADNEYHPKHIETLVQLHRETGAAVCTSRRSFHHLETGKILAYDHTSDGEQFSDTNCLMLTRAAFGLVATWVLMDPEDRPIGDSVMWHEITTRGLSKAHTGFYTLRYREPYALLYELAGIPVPAGARPFENGAPALARQRRREQGRELPPFRPEIRILRGGKS